MATWSQLSRDILGLILEKLPLADYIRLGSTCAACNSVVRSGLHRPKPQSPWLMIPNDDDETSARFFSLSEQRTYDIPLPNPPIRRRLCIGSSYGWLITVDDEECNIHLLNPITGTQIPLPSVATLPFVDAIRNKNNNKIEKFNLLYNLRSVVFGKDKSTDAEKEFSPDDFRCFFFLKAVLSSPPSPKDGSGDYVVMLITNPDDSLAFVRAGDEAWTPLRTPYFFQDVIPCGQSFYTLSWDGKIYAWDIDRFTDLQQHVEPLQSGILSFKPRLAAAGKHNDMALSYLTISLEGQLFVIYREQGGDKTGRDITRYCKLVKVERGTTRKWSWEKDMKDNVLFVGNNHSMALSAMEFPELRRNCIYFTDNNIQYAGVSRRHLKRDIGVYDIKKKRVKPLYHLPSHSTWPPSVWFTPILS